MTSLIAHLTVDCVNAFTLAEFWKRILGYTEVPGDPNQPGDPECLIQDPDSGQRLLFLEVPERKSAKNRLHIDLRQRGGTRDEELAVLQAHGAAIVADHRGSTGPGTGWVVLADPEGNEFCLLRSAAEVAAGQPTDRLIPPDFVAPVPPDTNDFVFERLGPEHNEADLAAWTSSIPFIKSLPGWATSSWPGRVFTPEENLADLVRHRDRHGQGRDFAWTVLDPRDRSRVIGCVYIDPDTTGAVQAVVRSWVIAERAALDAPLFRHIDAWVGVAWPFASYSYAPR